MHRREVLRLAVSSAALTAVAAPSVAHTLSQTDKSWIDGNLIPFYRVGGWTPERLAALKASRLGVVKLSMGGAIAQETHEFAEDLAWAQGLVRQHPDHFMIVRTPQDLNPEHRQGRLGIIPSLENAAIFQGDLDRITLFRDLGALVMQLTYNVATPFGGGVLSDAGLTPLGAQAVERMEELGVLLDLSHSNDATTFGALEVARRPVAITHAGAAAVHDHPRNKSDAVLKAISETGGVVGIYQLPYLTPSPQQPSLDHFVAHLLHVLTICGDDHVGLGSDLSLGWIDTSPEARAAFEMVVAERAAAGIGAPGEDRMLYVEGLNNDHKHRTIADALAARGLKPRVIDKIMGENFARVFAASLQ